MVFVLAATGILLVLGCVAIVLVVRAARTRCPGCRRGSVELDLRASGGGIEASTGAQMLRCTACNAEFRRLERGALIPRAAWDAGAREPLPPARVVSRAGR